MNIDSGNKTVVFIIVICYKLINYLVCVLNYNWTENLFFVSSKLFEWMNMWRIFNSSESEFTFFSAIYI